jgi:hypothetical protein
MKEAISIACQIFTLFMHLFLQVCVIVRDDRVELSCSPYNMIYQVLDTQLIFTLIYRCASLLEIALLVLVFVGISRLGRGLNEALSQAVAWNKANLPPSLDVQLE